MDIPFRPFNERESKRAYRYNLSPGTPDVAQDIDRYLPLSDRLQRGCAS